MHAWVLIVVSPVREKKTQIDRGKEGFVPTLYSKYKMLDRNR